MATKESIQENDEPVRPPIKDEVIAILNAFKEHIDSGGGLGRNEEGDEIVEIQEEWDAQGNIISQEALGASSSHPPPSTSLRALTEIEDSNEEALEEEEIEFDDDAFESMMQEMEELELAAEKSAAAVAAVVAETSKSTAKSSVSLSAAGGMKRGFLLPSGERITNSKSSVVVKETTTSAPIAAATTARPTAFTGSVVERQPETAVESGQCPTSLESQREPEAPQRVSKFKQRMYGAAPY